MNNTAIASILDWGYSQSVSNSQKEAVMPSIKNESLTYEEVSSALSYDAETGKFIWLIKPSKKISAGAEAGSFKGERVNKKTGERTRYMYIRLNGYDVPAGRVAWLLHYKQWPEGLVMFRDNDPSNIRINNLKEAEFPSVKTERGDKKQYSMSKDAQRHYGLKRYYGIGVDDFASMLLKQNGVCAICFKPETAIMHGQVKPLSVDHNHETGAIRELLCSSCNHLLGHAREDREVLLSALKYLDKHSGRAQEVSLHVVSPDKEGKRE